MMRQKLTLLSKSTALAVLSSALLSSPSQAAPTCEAIFQAQPPARKGKLEHIVLGEALGMHVNTHELTPELTARAVKALADYLDPMGMLFLEGEYKQMTNMSGEDLAYFHRDIMSYDRSTNFEMVVNEARNRLTVFLSELATSPAFRAEIENYDLTEQDQKLLALGNKSHPATPQEARHRFKIMIADQMSTILKANEGSGLSRQRAFVLTLRATRAWLETVSPAFSPGNLPAVISKAYLRALDAHSDYLLPHEGEQFTTRMSGELSGIGAMTTRHFDGILLPSIAPGGGAEAAGLKEGDIITHVQNDGIVVPFAVKTDHPRQWLFTRNLSLPAVTRVFLGQPGSQVRVRVKRGDQSFETVITRKKFQMSAAAIHSSVKTTPAGDILHVSLKAFYQNSAEQLRAEILKATQNGKIKGLVLDLRGNGGGSLTELTKIVGLFVKDGPAVAISNGQQTEVRPIVRIDKKPIWTGPLILLTNFASASASEGLSAALQAYGRALIVGEEQTFGKGSMQEMMWMTDGSGLKVTTALFFSPAGVSPQAQGVKSDLVVNKAPAEATYERDMDFVIPPITIPSALPANAEPMMPKRATLLSELQRRLEARLKTSANEQVTAKDDLAAEETYRIMKDLLELNAK